jgi:hypothetical protein
MATNAPSLIPSSVTQKMQYFSSSHPPQQAVDSPSCSKRASVVFVNDYAMSSLNNLAPAANDDYSRQERSVSEASIDQLLKVRSGFTAKLGSRFARKGKEIEKSLSPPRTRLPGHGKPPKTDQIEESASQMPLQSSSEGSHSSHGDVPKAVFSKPRRDELQVDFPHRRPSKKSEKMPGKERRKVFQRLADEKVPDEHKFKNRKLKADYITGKFGASIANDSTDLSTCGTLGSSLSDHRSSFSDFPPCKNNDIDDNFVDGLIFFAPTSENTIRELVQYRSPSA